jgi:plasmid stability protein
LVNQTHPTVRQASKKHITITISGMTPELVAALRCRARGHNRSMSGELREIIRAKLSQAETTALENTEQ